MKRFLRAHGAAAIAVLLVSVYYSVGVVWRNAEAGIGAPNYDTYGLYYPNLLYALDSLKTGHGLFWNRYQNCGQPFFSIAISANLYPPHLIYLLLDTYTGLYVLLIIHLMIAGTGTYWLGRELGLQATAAMCGAFFFQLSGLTLLLAMWEPNLVGQYAWIPAAMAACERGLRNPKVSNGALLGVLLTLQFLAGYPPITVFTYQLIALRVLWQCFTRWRSGPTMKGIAVIALGLALPVGLAAVQLYPSLEFAQQSLRGRTLSLDEIRPPHLSLTTAVFWKTPLWRNGYSTAFALIPLALSCVGLALQTTRRQAAFFLLTAAFYAALAFETPLFSLYRLLPLGSQFRMPIRFLWLTNFCLCIGGATGVEVLTSGRHRLEGAAKRVVMLFLIGAALAYPFQYRWSQKGTAVFAALLAMLPAALWLPAWNRLARWTLPVAVLAAITALNINQPFGYAARPSLFYEDAEVFEFVREHMSLQDRMYQITEHIDYSLQRKSASIFRVPSITDYETQTSERYAELFVRLLSGHPMRGVNSFYYQGTTIPQNRALLDLLAVRFVIIDTRKFAWRPAGFDLVWEKGEIQVLENRHASPRAFYVPEAAVVSDPKVLLTTLANPSHDPKRVVLVEETPRAGLGSKEGAGAVTILGDLGETVGMRVEATRSGFLFVSDQLYPGWRATVNGQPTDILRANYAFRAVAVPAGASTVEFSYRPLSLRAGAWVSALSSLALAIFLVLRWRTLRMENARPTVGAGAEVEPVPGD